MTNAISPVPPRTLSSQRSPSLRNAAMSCPISASGGKALERTAASYRSAQPFSRTSVFGGQPPHRRYAAVAGIGAEQFFAPQLDPRVQHPALPISAV
jgi:hypothetical protein